MDPQEKDWGHEEFQQVVAALEDIQERMSIAGVHTKNDSIRERCERVELVLRAALWMLKNDPGDTLHLPTLYIRDKISNGIAAYGLEVVSKI